MPMWWQSNNLVFLSETPVFFVMVVPWRLGSRFLSVLAKAHSCATSTGRSMAFFGVRVGFEAPFKTPSRLWVTITGEKSWDINVAFRAHFGAQMVECVFHTEVLQRGGLVWFATCTNHGGTFRASGRDYSRCNGTFTGHYVIKNLKESLYGHSQSHAGIKMSL